MRPLRSTLVLSKANPAVEVPRSQRENWPRTKTLVLGGSDPWFWAKVPPKSRPGVAPAQTASVVHVVLRQRPISAARGMCDIERDQVDRPLNISFVERERILSERFCRLFAH